MKLLSLSPDDFCGVLHQVGTRRAYAVFDRETQHIMVSHAALEPVARWLEENERDFDGHEAIFLERGKETNALMGAFIHKTVRGQAQGGLRFWPYDSVGHFLSDGLRLAQGMGRKNALAGLFWGGGKGVIARSPDAPHEDENFRRQLYREYGSFIASLNGAYITAEDVGTRPEDMAHVFSTTRFVTCVPRAVGGSGNPSPWTAKGVVCAMEAALDFAGLGSLSGKIIAMQGVGNVGSEMLAELLARGVAAVKATDISERNVAAVQERFRGAPIEVRQVERGDMSIFEMPADVLAPNALGGILNHSTIPKLRARIICGAANNQLLDATRDSELLMARNIIFVPDFVANRMGIVNCANEQYGRLEQDPAVLRHFDPTWNGSVFQVTRHVLERGRAQGISPTQAANQLADELGRVPHPLWGHRGQQIINDLVANAWHQQD